MSKTFVLGAVSILAALAIGAVVSGFAVKAHFEAILDTFVPDTVEVIKWDTIRVNKPVFVASRPIHDSIPVPVPYPVAVHDTLYLPKEQKYYADSTYRAWVSGVSPKLDSIEVYQKTHTIIQTTPVPVVKKQRLNIGVQAGVGAVQPFGQPFSPKLGYYVGIGAEWNF